MSRQLTVAGRQKFARSAGPSDQQSIRRAQSAAQDRVLQHTRRTRRGRAIDHAVRSGFTRDRRQVEHVAQTMSQRPKTTPVSIDQFRSIAALK